MKNYFDDTLIFMNIPKIIEWVSISALNVCEKASNTHTTMANYSSISLVHVNINTCVEILYYIVIMNRLIH